MIESILPTIKRIFGFGDAREPLAKETGSLPSWAVREIKSGICPFCYSPVLIGPRGGAAVNMLCADATCGVRYNIAAVEFVHWGEITHVLCLGEYLEVWPLFRRMTNDEKAHLAPTSDGP
jgi:hypothetical protein